MQKLPYRRQVQAAGIELCPRRIEPIQGARVERLESRAQLPDLRVSANEGATIDRGLSSSLTSNIWFKKIEREKSR